MKKLMIAAAIALAAVVTQAANVKWASGGSIQPDGKNNAAAGTLNLYVWTVASQDAFDKIALDSIWSTYGNTSLAAMGESATAKSASAFAGQFGGNAQLAVTAPASGTDTYHGVIILAYDSNKDGTVDMYAVNKVDATMNSAGTAGGGLNVGKYIGGGTSGDAVKWTAASVPEPTSALLVLLGMAGLALRRRRA